MTDTTLFAIDDSAHHRLIFGSSGKGRSGVLTKMAQQMGISYDEMLQKMEPTPEQKQAAYARAESRRNMEKARLRAVCEAYWANSTEESLSWFAEQVAWACGLPFEQNIPPAVLKQIFMTLPAGVVGLGIAYGFTDTEVRADVCQYLEQAAPELLKQISQLH